MECYGEAVILFSMQHFIAPALDVYYSDWEPDVKEDCNKDSKFNWIYYPACKPDV